MTAKTPMFLTVLLTSALVFGCGKTATREVESKSAETTEADLQTLEREVLTMFSGSWADGFNNPKLTLDFFDRGLKVKEQGFDERWIRIDWKNPADVHRWLKLQDDETLIFTDENSQVILKPWQYWRKINGLDK